jgi:hypothetical protein
MPNAELATQVKAAKSGKRLMFAFVAKGTEGTLLVGKKVAAQEIADAKKEAGGGTVYKGKCVGEGGVLWFETAKDVPTNLASAVKKVIRVEAGLTLDVLFRQKEDAESDEPEGKKSAKLDLDAGKAVVETQKPREQLELETRMNAMFRTFTVELTGKSEKAANAKKLFAETQALSKAKNYAEGQRKLDALEALMTRPAEQIRYEKLLRGSQPTIEAALPKRGGKQIKFHYDQAIAAAGAENWTKAIKDLQETNRLVGVAAARNPYLVELDAAKSTVEPLLGVKLKTDDPNALTIDAARTKLKDLWDSQDKDAKKKPEPDFPAAIANVKAALLCAQIEIQPLIAVKATAAKEKLATAELAVDRAKNDLAGATDENRAEKLAQVRALVTGLFASADEAKDLGVTASGAKIGGGGAPDRKINCEKMYKELDWFELKRRLNLPEKPDVAPENRENLTPGEMKQLWDWRSVEVNKLIDGLRSKYPTLIAKACGSNDLESDIDITFAAPGGEHFGDDILAAKEFNEKVIARFGKPAGRAFDVNIYARDYRAIKESRNQEYNAEAIGDVDVDQPATPPVGGMDFRTASAEDQDVAALMKQRRFMSANQWQDYSSGILTTLETEIKKKNPAANLKEDKEYQQVAKQLDEAEDVYLLSLRKILVGIQKTVTKRYPERVRSDPNFQKLDLLLRDPNAKNIETEMQKLHKLLTSGDYAPLAMEATDEMYLDQMADVRANQKKLESLPDGPEKESLKLQVKKDIFTNIFFANEAYTSEGAITHIVAGSQAGLNAEQLAEKLKPTETVQSANEQLADLLKDMEHYEEEEQEAREHGGDAAAVAGQAFVHASKYLERLLDATAILAAQFAPKKEGDPPAPDLTWFADNVKDTAVTGKTTLKDKSEALQKRVKGLLLNLRKSSKVPVDLKRPLAVDEVQQLFGVSTISAFTQIMMKLGQELNSVVRQRAQFQTALDVGQNVTSERMKNVDIGEREKALNVLRKLTHDPRALAPVQHVSAAFSKLDIGTAPQVSKMASEICNTWKAALEFLEQKRSDMLARTQALLGTRVKAIPDVEVANEFQGIQRWLGQAVEMLAMSAGPTATPKTKQIVANVNQAEVLSGRLYELTWGPRWLQTKATPTAEKKAKLIEDMGKMKAKVAPVLGQLSVDVIDDVPDGVKQRIVDVMRDLNTRDKDVDRRRTDLEKLTVVPG